MSKVKDPGRRDLRSCRGFPSVFCSRREVESRMSIVECGDCSATSGVVECAERRQRGERVEKEGIGESFIGPGPRIKFRNLCCAWRVFPSIRTCQVFACGFAAPIMC